MTTSSRPVWLLSPEGRPKDFSAVPSGMANITESSPATIGALGRGILAIVLLLAGLVFFSLAANWRQRASSTRGWERVLPTTRRPGMPEA